MLGKLDGISETIPDKDSFISMYVQKEAVLSSQIEGTQASLSDVLQKNKSKELVKETNEVVNYTNALNYGIKRIETLPLSLRLMRELHKKLLGNTRGSEKDPGYFRKSQNWLGTSGSTLKTATFVPPSIEYMTECLNNLEIFMNSSVETPELINVALIHYQFETIHPFLDGNGRIGRLLITLWLYDKGLLVNPMLYLSYYFKKNRNK